MLDISTRRCAANDMAARVENERGQGRRSVASLFCECGDRSCAELLYLTLGEFVALRRSGRLLIASGHAAQDELASTG